MPRPRLTEQMSPDVRDAIHAIWLDVDRLLGARNVDWHGRRIINAGDAVDDQDYITLGQARALGIGVPGPPGPQGPPGDGDSNGGPQADAQILSLDDATFAFPNSRVVVAGDGLSFDDSDVTELTINVLIGRDTRANQPAAADWSGGLYYVTDEFKTEYSNGSAWQTYDDYNSSGGRYYFGGLTASYPMWLRSGVIIGARLADDSDYATIYGGMLYAANNVGVGAGKTTTTAELEVAGQIRAEGEKGAGASSGIGFINTVQSDTLSANFLLRRSRDNAGSPEALQLGDFIAALVCQGYDGTDYGPTNNGAIIFQATENYNTGAKGTNIVFATTTTGTTTRVNRWQVNGVGDFESINGTEKIAWLTSGVTLSQGAGSPEGALTAPIGSLFLRNDGASGTTLYTKTSGSGNTGWEAAGAGASSGGGGYAASLMLGGM